MKHWEVPAQIANKMNREDWMRIFRQCADANIPVEDIAVRTGRFNFREEVSEVVINQIMGIIQRYDRKAEESMEKQERRERNRDLKPMWRGRARELVEAIEQDINLTRQIEGGMGDLLRRMLERELVMARAIKRLVERERVDDDN